MPLRLAPGITAVSISGGCEDPHTVNGSGLISCKFCERAVSRDPERYALAGVTLADAADLRPPPGVVFAHTRSAGVAVDHYGRAIEASGPGGAADIVDWREQGRQAAQRESPRAVPAGLHPRSKAAREFLAGYAEAEAAAKG